MFVLLNCLLIVQGLQANFTPKVTGLLCMSYKYTTAYNRLNLKTQHKNLHIISIILKYKEHYQSSKRLQSGTNWSQSLENQSFCSFANQGWYRISSDVKRSEGSLLNKDLIRHLARGERYSGMTKWPLDIFTNKEMCSESLKGYLEQKNYSLISVENLFCFIKKLTALVEYKFIFYSVKQIRFGLFN